MLHISKFSLDVSILPWKYHVSSEGKIMRITYFGASIKNNLGLNKNYYLY